METAASSAAVSTADDLAREVNLRVRRIAESLAARGDDHGHTYTFFCECGCLRPVTLTLAEYQAAGALLDGHSFSRP